MRFHKYAPQILIGLGIVSLSVGIGLLFKHPSAQPAAQAPESSAQAPATTKPKVDDLNNYTVAPDVPRFITISKLNVKARVRSLGVTKDNAIDSPANVYDAGWFNQSSKPGTAGALVIDGHVSSETTHGIFYDLKSLKTGDTITLERGDGKTFSYAVVSSRSYAHDNVDMNAVLKPVDSGTPGLNLITCSGKVIKGTHEFDQRTVVFAKQIQL